MEVITVLKPNRKILGKGWIIASCIICIYLSGIFSLNAQDLIWADSLRWAGKQQEAALAYEFCYFHSTDQGVKNQALIGKAQCQKELEQYNEALNTLDRIPLFNQPDSILNTILFEKALNHYYLNDNDLAYSQLQIIFSQSKSYQFPAVNILYIMVLNSLGQFQQAENFLYEWKDSLAINHQKDSMLLCWIDLYQTSVPRLKKEKTLFVLSFVPGLGLAYCGFPGKGLLNFTLCSASLSFGIWQILSGNWITGYVVGGVLLQKFYFGGRTLTEQLAREKNKDKINTFNTLILENFSDFLQ